MNDAPKQAHPCPPPAQWNNSRRRAGCWMIFALFVILFLFAAHGASEDAKKKAQLWESLRPKDVSTQKWAERLALCKEVGFEPEQCAAKPMEGIRSAIEKMEVERRAQFCAKDAGIAAVHWARGAVLPLLKAPSTAEFAGGENISQDGCSYTIQGTVDAENSFGAKLRSAYRVRLNRVSETDWTVLQAQVD